MAKMCLIFIVLSGVTVFLFFEDTQIQYAVAFAPTPSQEVPQDPQLQSSPSTSSQSSETQSESNSSQPVDSSLTIYENTTAGVKVNYPSDWSNIGSYRDEFSDFIASFQSPVDKHGRPSIVILSKSLDGEENMQGYANTYFQKQEKNVPGYKVEEIKTDGVTIGGKPGYRAVVTYNICVAEDCGGEEKRGKMLEEGTLSDDGKIIAINYDSYESEYSKYLPIAERMVDSLELN